MQALSLDQLVGQILGNYRIERFLGQGRLNAVYLGRHLASQRLDAITMYLVPAQFSSEANTRFLKRFHKESAAITKLDHPHILPIYEYGEYVGTPYLVTPYVTQGSLADLLKRCGRYEHTAVVPILEQLASGIAYAHSKGYIHGTLGPANVVVRDEDTLQVAGFGLMHMLQLSGIERSERPYAHLLTVGQTFLAAPEYVAPEVVQGQVVDVRSDIYALGCILFELLCGRPPFTGSAPLEIAEQHVAQDIPSVRTICPEVPIALVSVVNQALERDPARRFRHVEELKEAFIQASRGAVSRGAQEGRYAEKVQSESERVQVSRRLQETPPSGYRMSETGKWQLLPPIVTGKVPAVQLSTAKRVPVVGANPLAASEQQIPQSRPAPVTLPPIGSALPPVASIANDSLLAPDVVDHTIFAPPQRVVTGEEKDLPSGRKKAVPEVVEPAWNSVPGVYEDTKELALSYSWWSQDGVEEGNREEDKRGGKEGSEEGGKERGKPVPYGERREGRVANAQAAQVPPTREPLRVTSSEDWLSEPVAPIDARRRPGSLPKKSSKVRRRRVVAFLAAGGVVAAGIAVGANFSYFGRLLGMGQQYLATRPDTKANTTVPGAGMNTQTMPNTNTQNKKGTVIGNTQQAVNSAVQFVNTANDTPGYLMRLTNDTFVAYERACTHAGVLVNYDPVTRMLRCPAHGAVFDPANGGAVVQGPTQTPLPKIGIQVQADGTVTTVN